MDVYMVCSLIIMVLVAASVVMAVKLYQRIRLNTGYHAGKFFNIGQYMGALIGDDHFRRQKVDGAEADDKVDPNEEMYIFSDSDQ